MAKLSIVIPARNEEFVARTVQDLLENIRGDTEIIVVLDGYWPNPPLYENPRLKVIHLGTPVGQRAAQNIGVSASKAKYVMKLDAHCAVDEGFDVKMMDKMQDDWTMVPIMKNLWGFDWICTKCGDRRYQGPTPTKCQDSKCDGKEFKKVIFWKGKPSPNSTSYCFDTTLHFQYFAEFKKRPEGHPKDGITETMSLQGSCFMCTREKYWELKLCDESWGNWGQQGVEVALKTWLSGGRVVCNWTTWYAHMFRTQGGDFGFPWPHSGRQVQQTRQLSRDIFFNNRYEKQIRPLFWLIERFSPVPYWTPDDPVYQKVKEAAKKFK